MENLFSISKTAKMVNMTAETLRHYDRIGLVHPHKVDKWTGYRYYSPEEIVRLNAINALRCMDMSLEKIKEILNFNDFDKIVDYLNQAEIAADKKIDELNRAKERIERAKKHYIAKKFVSTSTGEIFVQKLSKRVIMLADNLDMPTVDNLWNYHRHFYAQIKESEKDKFSFEDTAGRYETDDKTKMFVICEKFASSKNLVELPAGEYLSVNCNESEYDEFRKKLLETAKQKYLVCPKFIVSIVQLTGILKWDYQLQVLINEGK
ncbi:MAG TPA: MerR family transcriptional regulator [Candidatus Onthoplasma faecigallinarum]|nr:MerR family transcriptional regulator [Candidatus Onthoplasma faecigallinarum]